MVKKRRDSIVLSSIFQKKERKKERKKEKDTIQRCTGEIDWIFYKPIFQDLQCSTGLFTKPGPQHWRRQLRQTRHGHGGRLGPDWLQSAAEQGPEKRPSPSSQKSGMQQKVFTQLWRDSAVSSLWIRERYSSKNEYCYKEYFWVFSFIRKHII